MNGSKSLWQLPSATAVAVLVALTVAGLGREAVEAPAKVRPVAARASMPARVLEPRKRPRPDGVEPDSVVTSMAPNELQIYNDFASRGYRHSSERAAVHYVVRGVDAPPLNDDDADTVPDYVERVSEAADRAIAYFERRGFRKIRADASGGDASPDLYISRFAAGTFGVAFPAQRAEGGAFAVVANNLDPSSEECLACLQGTVAHELFHLVQFSYFPVGVDPPLPGWVLEGTAAALEGRAFPGLDDIVWSLQLRPWLAATEQSITRQTYASRQLWQYLDRRSPRLIEAYLARWGAGRAAGEGATALAATYRRLNGGAFAQAFHRFAVAMGDDFGLEITPRTTLARGGRVFHSSLPGLAVDYVRLATGRRTPRSVVLRLDPRGAAAATLSYQLASEYAGRPSALVHIAAVSSDGGRTLTFRIPDQLGRNDRFQEPTLVVSNGSAIGTATYTVASR